jgi:septal ring factor EnvC (AmiA/AmiB activator)
MTEKAPITLDSIFKVGGVIVALIGGYFTMKSDINSMQKTIDRLETQIELSKLEVTRLAVLEAQQKMTEQSLSEIKETLKTIDSKVDQIRKK